MVLLFRPLKPRRASRHGKPRYPINLSLPTTLILQSVLQHTRRVTDDVLIVLSRTIANDLCAVHRHVPLALPRRFLKRRSKLWAAGC